MATTTVYDIKVRYMLNDQASRSLSQVGKAAERASKGTSRLDRTIKRLAVGAAGFLSFRMGKKLLVDYNAELEQARIQMGGLLQMNMGGTWAQNQGRANQLVRQFTDDAKKSTATTKDFVNFASLITGPLSRAGASMEEIREITKGGVIAARAFGIEGEFAARDIEQALVGTLGKKDRFARALLEPMGITTAKWNEMVTKTPSMAAKMLTQAFNQPAIQNMADQQAKSWAGVTSTLTDNLQRAFGKVGLPLVKRMGEELSKLNAWFDRNPREVARLVDKMAQGMLTAFDAAKRAIGFLVENRALVMALAKAYIASKGIGMLTGGLQSIASVGSMFTKLAEGGLLKFSGGITGVIGKLGALGSAVAIAAVGIESGFAWLADRDEAKALRKGNVAHIKQTLEAFRGFKVEGGKRTVEGIQRTLDRHEEAAKRKGLLNIRGLEGRGVTTGGRQHMAASMLAQARDKGFLKGDQIQGRAIMKAFQDDKGTAVSLMQNLEKAMRIDREATALYRQRAYEGLQRSFDESVQDNKGNLRKTVREFEKNNSQLLVAWMAAVNRNKGDVLGTLSAFWDRTKVILDENAKKARKEKRAKARGLKNTEVKISKIEVISDDPDRFAMNLIGALDDFNSSPTQAVDAIREG